MRSRISVWTRRVQSAGAKRRRSFISTVCDVGARKVLDVFCGRQRDDLSAWLETRSLTTSSVD